METALGLVSVKNGAKDSLEAALGLVSVKNGAKDSLEAALGLVSVKTRALFWPKAQCVLMETA